jgi:adenine specific DNA methylase Mod
MGSLYFGDNLYVLRNDIKSESVDLVYLDPPFNSKRDYNLLFKTPKGHDSDAQITAFDDSWHWGEQAEREFAELLHQSNTDVSEMIQSLRRFLKESDMMAYLTMMANRLVELHRVLKSSGSLYLHCDPTASHYLKIVLDTVFGAENFRNEITWKRRHGFSSAVHDSNRYGNCTDTILFYAKSNEAEFTPQYNRDTKDYQEYVENFFTLVDEHGRKYQATSLTNPAYRPNLIYEYKGYKPPANGWMITKEKMEQWDKEGRIHFPKDKNGRLRRKSFADELKGMPIQNLWDDIEQLGAHDAERLGYPTQKPLALLERVIQASSKSGDIVLDPFCGCGTAVHAAQNLGREWIGIDITHLAIGLIEKRMKFAFPNITFEIQGTPKDLAGARDLAERDKYQFQWWACSLVGAQPYQGKKKGADGGIDGIIFFQDNDEGAKKIIVSVKGGESVTRTMIADLKNTVEREKAEIGLFVTLAEPTKPMITEAASAGFYESPKGAYPKIQILTIADLLSGKEKPQFYDMALGGLNFKKAKVEQQRAEQKKLL